MRSQANAFGNCTIDLARIVGLEIAINRCPDISTSARCESFDNPSVSEPPEEHVGTLYLDEFAAVDLKPGAVNRLRETGFETVTPNPTVRAKAANALLAQIVSSGPGKDLIPAWFPETNPNFDSYVQAEVLLVFVYEYERTGNVAFRDAAQKIATSLRSLQIPAGRTQSGAWFSAYRVQGEVLIPPDRASQLVPCDGNETLVQDIDACESVGNVGWLLTALGKLQRSGFYNNPTALKDALDRGAAWVAGQFNRNVGIEGSISAYFGLLAAGKRNEAALLGQAIFQLAWDPIQRRLKPGGGPADAATPIDVTGSWGVTFLRSLGRSQEALDSQAYAASIMRVCSFDGSVCGYGDIAGPYTPAIEFTAQAASAGIKDADFVMQQLSSLQIPNNGTYPGAFPGAADHWYGGPLTPWNTTMAGVSPTAWVYFAQNCDPLLDLSVPTLSLSVNQCTFRTGDTLRMGLKAQNPGPAFQTDFYFGVLLPDGMRLFFFTGLSPIKDVETRLDANPKTFQALVSNILIPQGLDVTIDDFLVLTFAANFPSGTYIFFAFLTSPGVFTDGRVDTGDILVIDTKSLSFVP